MSGVFTKGGTAAVAAGGVFAGTGAGVASVTCVAFGIEAGAGATGEVVAAIGAGVVAVTGTATGGSGVLLGMRVGVVMVMRRLRARP